MTDVPFAAVAVVATWLFARGFLRQSRALLFAGSIAAAAAFLIRQHGVWIPAAAAATSILLAMLERRHARPHNTDSHAPPPRSMAPAVTDAAVSIAVPLAVVVAYTAWTMTSDVVPLAVQNKIGEAASVSALAVGNAAFRGAATLGFLMLPWAWTVRRPRGAERTVFFVALGLFAAGAVFLYAREGATMFYLSNMLADLHVGPLTTRDAQFLAREPWPSLGPVFHFALTAASITSTAILSARLFGGIAGITHGTRAASAITGARDSTADGHSVRAATLSAYVDAERARPGAATFCLIAFALSALGTLAQSHYFFDRYLIVLVPLAIAALVAVSPSLELRSGFAATLGVLSLYAVAGTHDYMAWNRARWDLLAGLEARGVSPRAIDGGVEYNGERLAAEMKTSPSDADARRGQPQSRKSWWWVVDDQWIVALSPLDGYAVSEAREFVRWLPPGQGTVLLLERRTGAD
jgi:hypothetical protein